MKALKFTRRDVVHLCLSTLFLSPIAQAAEFIPSQRKSSMKSIILYFSQPETQSSDNMTREEALSTVVEEGRVWGNNEWLAELIRRETQAKFVRIVPQSPYPTEHSVLIAHAKVETEQNLRPAIAKETLKELQDLSEYDRVYLVTPIWWYTFPMIIYTLLESIDLSGKEVAVVTSHGGSGFADTVARLRERQKNIKVLPGFEIYREDMDTAKEEIKAWLMKNMRDQK